ALADQLGVPLTIAQLDALSSPIVVANPADRCYHCKQVVFDKLWELARADGHTVLCDGTNADDDESDRPGMKALRELGVRSPLREFGLIKADIRAQSREAGLFTHDKPSYACLATRIPTGTAIASETLAKIERAEGRLFDLGFTDFRVRLNPPDGARIQLPGNQLDKAIAERTAIAAALGPDFDSVLLDLAVVR
ncbi:MAG: TIGR00268 family protein, partial [Oscillospiraceae bacterium]|nr:TIGR00268 family protein [Oscillospiraceae bacterium]